MRRAKRRCRRGPCGPRSASGEREMRSSTAYDRTATPPDGIARVSWLAVDPHLYVLALIAAALAFRALGRGRASVVATAAALTLIVVAGVFPTGQIALSFLEARFPPWTGEGSPPTGIVVLGGAINGLTPYPGSGFSEASGRFFEAVALAHRFPETKVVYSGGGGEARRG